MIRQGLVRLDALDPVISGGKRIDLDDQLVLQRKSRVRLRYLQGTVRQQRRTEHQDHRQGDLARHRETAPLSPEGPQHATAGFLHLAGKITLGQPQSGSQTEQQRGHQAQAQRGRQDTNIQAGPEVSQPGSASGRDPDVENPHAPESQQNAEDPSQQRQQQRLEEQLPDDPPAAPAEGQTDGDLAVARGPCTISMFARFRQAITRMIADTAIRTRLKMVIRRRVPFRVTADREPARRAEIERGMASPVLGIFLSETRDQGLQLCLGDRHGHVRLESSHEVEPTDNSAVRASRRFVPRATWPPSGSSPAAATGRGR